MKYRINGKRKHCPHCKILFKSQGMGKHLHSIFNKTGEDYINPFNKKRISESYSKEIAAPTLNKIPSGICCPNCKQLLAIWNY